MKQIKYWEVKATRRLSSNSGTTILARFTDDIPEHMIRILFESKHPKYDIKVERKTLQLREKGDVAREVHKVIKRKQLDITELGHLL